MSVSELSNEPNRTVRSDWLPLAEVADQLGVSSASLRMQINRGKRPGEKFGRRWFTPLDFDSEQVNRTERTVRSQVQDAKFAAAPDDRLIESQRGEIKRLRSELDVRSAEIERRDVAERELRILIANQSSQLVELSTRVLALEANNRDINSESDEEAGGARESIHTTDSTRDGQIVDHAESGEPEPTTRPWWRFWRR